MINISRKDTIFSYIGYFLRLFSNIIILPLILNKVSPAEYGVWSVFLSVGAFATLFDLGFGNVITRYVTYASCGAKDLPLEGIPEKTINEVNYNLLFEILLTAKKLYRRVGSMVVAVLSFFTFYIVYISHKSLPIRYTIIAWSFYAIGISISMYFNYLASFFKGLGKIKELQKIIIVNQLLYIIIQYIFVFSGLGIIGLGISNLLSMIFLRVQLAKHINSIINTNKIIFIKVKQRIKCDKVSDVYKAISYNSKKIGYILISNYIQGQGSTLLCSAFLSLEQTAMYGLAMQLVGIISNLATIPFNTYLPQLSAFRMTNHIEKLKKLLFKVTIWIFLIFILGSIVLTYFGENAISIIKSNTKLLPTGYLVLILFYQFININHQRATNFISVGNSQPYVRAYIISSFLSLILNTIIFYMGFGLIGFILVNIVVQLSYNAWKWPLEAMRIAGLNIKDTLNKFKNFSNA